jgi:hypothetical protein
MTAGSFFGAAQDGIKRHDDGKVLHSTHGLRQYITSAAGLLLLALRLRRLPRFPRRLDSGSFFGAAQDGMKRHDGGKVLHSAAKIGTQRQNAAQNASEPFSSASISLQRLVCYGLRCDCVACLGSLGASILAAFSARHQTA